MFVGPEPEEQLKVIREIENNPENKLKAGPKQAFLINAQWFRSWKDFVGYFTSTQRDIEMSPIDNSNLVNDRGHKKRTIEERKDYEVLAPKVWDQLQKWYGGGPPVSVPVIDHDGNTVVPSRFYEFKVEWSGETRTVGCNNFTIIRKLHERIRRKFAIPESVKTYLAYRKTSGTSTFTLKALDSTVRDAGISDIVDVLILLKETHEQAVAQFYGTKNRVHSENDAIARKREEIESSFASIAVSRHAAFKPGVVGLENLGNTCFLNSGIQCLFHSRLLMKYFLDEDWKAELNLSNPLGTHGDVVDAFANLAKRIWSGNHYLLSPSSLKEAIGRFVPQFSGYSQQDSHELITFLLDGIHEDLNRCRVKPIVEAVNGDGTNDSEVAQKSWENYKSRNNSIIVDLFQGQLRSTLRCPQCKKTTVVFDPYMSLPLPVAKPLYSTVCITFVPYDLMEKCMRFRVKVGPVSDMSQLISKRIGREVRVIVVSHLHETLYGDKYAFGMSPDYTDYYAVEIPDPSKKYVIGRIRLSHNDFSGPVVMAVDDFDRDLAYISAKYVKRLRRIIWNYEATDNEEVDRKAIMLKDQEMRFVVDRSWKGEKVFSTFHHSSCEKLAPSRRYANIAWPTIIIYLNPALLKRNAWQGLLRLNEQKQIMSPVISNKSIRLDKCFDYFSMNETLDVNNQWFCPHCRAFVCADKKMDIWSAPKVLVIQLKRFTSRGDHLTKSSAFVDFPDELDMEKHVVGPQKDERLKYRLYAVSEHSGGIYGGHYTCQALVALKDQSLEGGQWYSFNDSIARKSSVQDTHTQSAYVLFYERLN